MLYIIIFLGAYARIKKFHLKRQISSKCKKVSGNCKLFFPFPQALCSQHESYIKGNQPHKPELTPREGSSSRHIFTEGLRSYFCTGVTADPYSDTLLPWKSHTTTLCLAPIQDPPSHLLWSLPAVTPRASRAAGRTGARLTLPGISTYRKI